MKVVVIGGGFGGLAAVKGLQRTDVEVTLIDRRNFHLFQPLLYQVATGALSPANIAAPLRSMLRRQRNTSVVLGEVVSFDLDGRRVLLEDGDAIEYDVLVVAAGSRYNYFGHPEWEEAAPSLKTLEDATSIRSRILRAFEQAELAPDEAAARAAMTFVVIGGGPTGVETAGAIAELARHTLRDDFRRIQASRARIVLVEALDRVLPPYPPSLSRKAQESLTRLGVEVRTGTRVTAIDRGGLTLESSDGEERIQTATVVWAAGVTGTPLASALAQAAGQPVAAAGRLAVSPELTLPGHPEVFVIGDMALLEQEGRPLPAVAPVAIQQGSHVAKSIRARLAGKPAPPFRYRNKGSMATIGRSAAVADLGKLRLSGFAGWVAWLTVHLMMMVRFENRVLVLVQWAWNYFTRGRSARLITGERRE